MDPNRSQAQPRRQSWFDLRDDPLAHLGGALMEAAKRGDVELARSALAAGADPSRTDSADNQPMHWAIIEGRREVVALLAPLVDGGFVDDWGLTHLGHAIRAGRQECALALLPWADLDAKLERERSPRDYALIHGMDSVAQAIDAERARREALALGEAIGPGGDSSRAGSGPRL